MRKSVSNLPTNIAEKFRSLANYLLADLEDNKFHVVLVPAPDPKHRGHKIRQATKTNPQWYRDIYYSKSRGPIIRGRKREGGQGQIRKRVGSALLRIINSEDKHHSYHILLRELIKKMLCEGYETDYGEVPPDDDVLMYFNEK